MCYRSTWCRGWETFYQDSSSVVCHLPDNCQRHGTLLRKKYVAASGTCPKVACNLFRKCRDVSSTLARCPSSLRFINWLFTLLYSYVCSTMFFSMISAHYSSHGGIKRLEYLHALRAQKQNKTVLDCAVSCAPAGLLVPLYHRVRRFVSAIPRGTYRYDWSTSSSVHFWF